MKTSFDPAQVERFGNVCRVVTHLVRARCACGAEVLCTPERAGGARCGPCLMASAPACTLPAPTGEPAGRVSLRAAVDKVEGLERVAPVVSSRDGAEPVRWPGAVLKLAEFALEAGWQVRRQYARGVMPHGTTGRQNGAVKDSFAVIMWGWRGRADGVRAYAVYRGTGWDSVCMVREGRGPVAGGSVTDLREWLCVGGAMPDMWWLEVEARALDAVWRTKFEVKDGRVVKKKAGGRKVESGG